MRVQQHHRQQFNHCLTHERSCDYSEKSLWPLNIKISSGGIVNMFFFPAGSCLLFLSQLHSGLRESLARALIDLPAQVWKSFSIAAYIAWALQASKNVGQFPCNTHLLVYVEVIFNVICLSFSNYLAMMWIFDQFNTVLKLHREATYFILLEQFA